MSNFFQALFNTNHDQPSFLVFVILALIAIVVPNVTRYLYDSRKANGSTKTSSSSSQNTSSAKPRHQHKKKKR